LILTYGICIPLGIAKAVRHGTRFDNASSVVVFLGYAVPSYVISIALILTFAAHLDWFPLGGFVGDDFENLSTWKKIGDVIYHAALPLTAYLAGSFAVTTLMMKNALMDNLSADYMRTAMAKGHDFNGAVRHHALRNSLIPIATSFGSNISLLLSGSFLIETIFNIDGIGLLGFESVLERDYPVVMGILVISALLFLIGNILSDLCVALVDPRIRFTPCKVSPERPMRRFQFNPLTRRRWARFRDIKRGYWSAITLGVLIALSLVAELWVNQRALIVQYNQQWFFPTYGAVIPGRTFGLDYDYETDYKALQKQF